MTSFLTHAPALIAAHVGLAGCALPAAPAAPASTVANSILATSTPSAGSVVPEPVNSLMLHFSTPATLHEVIVSGPEGAMPTMISPVGAVE